jgi:hypothetical protein
LLPIILELMQAGKLKRFGHGLKIFVMVKKLTVPNIRSSKASAIQQQEAFAQASNPLTELETIELEGAELDELGNIITQAHNAFQSHLVSALQAALIAGKALLAAKDMFNYDRDVGGFRGWVEGLGLSKSASYRYIDLARHDEIVSQAGTLSEALDLVAQYKAEQRAIQQIDVVPQYVKRRTTLTLNSEKDAKLEQIAADRGIEISSLVAEIIDRWLSRQKIGN